MTQQSRTGEEDPPRDPVLEAAFTHLVQQAQVSPEFTARARAHIEALDPEVPPRPWPGLDGSACRLSGAIRPRQCLAGCAARCTNRVG